MDKWDETGEVGIIRHDLLRIGMIVTFQDKPHYILASTSYQEDSGEKVEANQFPNLVITTFYTLLELTDEGEDAGFPAEKATADQITII